MIRFDASGTQPFLSGDAMDRAHASVLAARRTLVDGSGSGNAFLGWRDVLRSPDPDLMDRLRSDAEEIRERADILVCIGIGGSYLGARAVLDALGPYFGPGRGPEILFAGHHMSGAYVRDLLDRLEGRSVYLNVISKSGTTLEPALAFRFLRKWVEDRFEDAERRILVTTDPEHGALNVLQREKGYRKYVIPPSVGGRFSVLTPVGLLPLAAAGVDVTALFDGAVDAFHAWESEADNPAVRYAATRHLLYEAGYTTEILAVFEPRLAGIGGWWQQLFGESEGKDGKGIFPSTLQYSTDLHSLGQYVQDGRRTLMETFLVADEDDGGLTVPAWPGDEDGLNYLAGRTLSEINRKAFEGTARAHLDGLVPVMRLGMDRISEREIGQLLYFFQFSVAVSGYLLGVNPFDQPGVEAYKKEMFRLLGRP